MTSARWIVLALGVLGCRPAGPAEAKPLDVDVPKLDPARTATAAPFAPVSNAEGGSMTQASANGWMVRKEEGLSPAYVDRATALDAIRKAKPDARAVLVYDETVEECSSMGGSHAFFTIAGGGSRVCHYGGHGAALMHAFARKGEVWVASVENLAAPESVKNEMWCVPDRTIHARAIALVPVATVEDGRRLLRELTP